MMLLFTDVRTYRYAILLYTASCSINLCLGRNRYGGLKMSNRCLLVPSSRKSNPYASVHSPKRQPIPYIDLIIPIIVIIIVRHIRAQQGLASVKS